MNDYGLWTQNCLEPEDSGEPGVTMAGFAGAIQVWATCQQARPVTVGEASRVFNCPLRLIADAVKASPWMALSGGDDPLALQAIELDGE